MQITQKLNMQINQSSNYINENFNNSRKNSDNSKISYEILHLKFYLKKSKNLLALKLKNLKKNSY